MKNKKEQRLFYKNIRENIDAEAKEILDKSIFDKLIIDKKYVDCEELLIYVSNGIEVDTRKIIEKAIKDGKRVFVPKVTTEKRVMKFFEIRDFEDLTISKFGVYEPITKETWINKNKSLCVVPAFVYDRNGYRIGYGGGYYDYFLGNNEVDTIGIIYDEFIIDEVFVDIYDQKVDKIVTDKRVINLMEAVWLKYR